MSKAIKEKRPKNLKNPISINAFRLDLNEKEIVVEFGEITDNKDKETVDIVASMKLEPEFLRYLVVDLFKAGLDYQAKFSNDIGFPDPAKYVDTAEKE